MTSVVKQRVDEGFSLFNYTFKGVVKGSVFSVVKNGGVGGKIFT